MNFWCCLQLKVMKYQDEVEAGKRSRKSDMTLAEQVEHYRRKLLAKVCFKCRVLVHVCCSLSLITPFFLIRRRREKVGGVEEIRIMIDHGIEKGK